MITASGSCVWADSSMMCIDSSTHWVERTKTGLFLYDFQTMPSGSIADTDGSFVAKLITEINATRPFLFSFLSFRSHPETFHTFYIVHFSYLFFFQETRQHEMHSTKDERARLASEPNTAGTREGHAPNWLPERHGEKIVWPSKTWGFDRWNTSSTFIIHLSHANAVSSSFRTSELHTFAEGVFF